MEKITHASLALEDSMRHQPEFKPTTIRVDILLQILASAREARVIGMKAATLGGTFFDNESDLDSLKSDLVRLGYSVTIKSGSRCGAIRIEWGN